MQKIFVIALFLIISSSTYAQKGKKTSAHPSAKKTVLAKSGNITAELVEKKDSYKFYLLVGKDSLLIKSNSGKANIPVDCKIVPFTSKGSKLHSLSWIEKSVVGDAKTKIENITYTHTQIWDISGKAKIMDNVQMVNNITEIVWLDPNKTASKTVDKIRRDGFEFILTKEGDVILKNKTQEDHYSYDAAQKKFVGKKKK